VEQDIEKTVFWTAAIKSLEEPLNRLQAIVPRVLSVGE
jgi:hypothetical protein